MVATQKPADYGHIDLYELKSRYNLAEVVEFAGITLNGGPEVRQGACPFHDETNPSFTVYLNTQKFHCFGCEVHGDLYDFVGKLQNATFRATVLQLAAGVGYPLRTTPLPARRSPDRRPIPRDRELYTAAMRYYYQQLHHEGPNEGAHYLRNRGITVEASQRLLIGYSRGAGLRDELLNQGFNNRQLQESGLFTPGGERFNRMVIVPDINPRAQRVEWVVGRTIDPGVLPRFQAPPGSKPILGMARLGLEPRWMILTEGVFDWITLTQWGYPAAAMLGTGGVEWVADNLKGCRYIFLALDNDQAGCQAANQLQHLLGHHAAVIHLPRRAKDIADLATSPNGAIQFNAALVQAANERRRSASR